MRPNLLITLLILLAWTSGSAGAVSDNLQLGGYLRGSGSATRLSEPLTGRDSTWLEYRLHQRLDLRWHINATSSLHGGLRTRLFGGDPIRRTPGYNQGLSQRQRLVDLSWKIIDQNSWLLLTEVDRLYLELHHQNLTWRIGRQRVNWGINLLTNPNDIFNMYSIYDYDYPERPGSDAIRMQYFTGADARIDLAVSPARTTRQSIAAALYGFRIANYEIQLLGGYFRNRAALGGGWAGDVHGSGFKGELMVFTADREVGNSVEDVIIATSLDYRFSSGLFAVVELLYNRNGGTRSADRERLELTADRPSLTRYQLASHLSYAFSPVLGSSLTAIYFPRETAIYLSPALTWSVTQNLDLQILGQAFIGGDNTPLENAGRLISAWLQYNF